MGKARITQRWVDAIRLSPGHRVELWWDQTVAGFGLRVSASRRVYIAQYRAADHRTYRLHIGLSENLSADQAREIARQLILTRQLPSQTADVAPSTPQSVAQLLSLFISEYVEKRHKATTQKEELRLIQRIVLTRLGPLQLSELTRAKVIEWHTSLPPKISANRALAHLSKACSFALQRNWLSANPCTGIERNHEVVRDRSFTDIELRRIGDVARGKRRELWECICVLALTGMRSSEVLNLTTDAFDQRRSIIMLADSKTGRRPVVLLPFAAQYCQTINSNFKQRIAASPASFSKAITRIMQEAQVRSASAHTFRHTLATFMAQHGDSVFQIAAMGGWKTLAMVQRYVNLHGVGTPHPTPADQRIAEALGLDKLGNE